MGTVLKTGELRGLKSSTLLLSAGLKNAEFSEENLSLVMTAEGFDSPTRLQFYIKVKIQVPVDTAGCGSLPVTQEI